ncbi:MAG: hypothetical protein HY010_12720 [Acidobacteria bacterium]|nr:hypothetical protein [Acidobacteriota bacterium]
MECRAVSKLSFSDLQKRLKVVPNASRIVSALEKFIGPKQPEASEPLFFEAEYEYGDLIVDNGVFVPPCGADANNCEQCLDLKNRVSYSSVPLSLVLNQCVEVFTDRSPKLVDNRNKLVPLKIIESAELFGTFETLDYFLAQCTTKPPWSVSAGSRSVWILAPLNDNRLPSFLSETTGADVYWDRTEPQWKLIKSSMKTSPWKTSIILFSRSFIETVKKNRTQANSFFKLLLETGWLQSAPFRHSTVEHAELRTWFLEGPARSIPAPLGELYQFATVCHILSIARGDIPAFQPAGSAKTVAGPFIAFEKALYEALSLLKPKTPDIARYFPVVLQPGHLTSGGASGYYSFRCPSIAGPTMSAVPNFSEIPDPIRRTLNGLKNGFQPEYLDREKSTFFAQSGRYSVTREGSQFPWQDFFSHVKHIPLRRSNLYTESAFLISGMRIVRSADAQLARHSAA